MKVALNMNSKYHSHNFRLLGMKIIKVSYFLSVTCECTTPNAGMVRKNEIKCGNETRHCSKGQECYATGKFAHGQWSDGCRVSCECSTPGKGTVGKNEIKCGNETRHCSKVKECYATEKFAYGEWSDGCRIPGTLK